LKALPYEKKLAIRRRKCFNTFHFLVLAVGVLSFPPVTFSFPTGLIPRTLGPCNVIILLSGWICLHGVLD